MGLWVSVRALMGQIEMYWPTDTYANSHTISLMGGKLSTNVTSKHVLTRLICMSEPTHKI